MYFSICTDYIYTNISGTLSFDSYSTNEITHAHNKTTLSIDFPFSGYRYFMYKTQDYQETIMIDFYKIGDIDNNK